MLNLGASEDLSLRVHPSFYDESTQTVYVDIELQYNGYGTFHLADQNYRLYFDSELMVIDEDYSRSDLPQDLYSAITISEIYENLDADEINQLSFDDQLGFINFNIDLIDTEHGGVTLRRDDRWHRVAVLAFQVEDQESLSQIVWSRAEVTNEYATAFVEIMEWIAPNKTKATEIDDYVDMSFNPTSHGHDYSVEVYPNPSSDFIKITFDSQVDQRLLVKVYDAAGRAVINDKILKGGIDMALAISQLQEGNYKIELTSTDNKRLGHSSFMKIGS